VPVVDNRIGGRDLSNTHAVRRILQPFPALQAEKAIGEHPNEFGDEPFRRSKYIIRDERQNFIADIYVNDEWDDEVAWLEHTDDDLKKARSFIEMVVYAPTIIRQLLDRIEELQMAKHD
jgi:hypothetical protein